MRPQISEWHGKLYYTVNTLHTEHIYSWDRKTRTWVSQHTQTSFASIRNMRRYSGGEVTRWADQIKPVFQAFLV